jgi:hypothetical protein
MMTSFEELLLEETRHINANLKDVQTEVSELRKDLAVQGERHEHTKSQVESLALRVSVTEQHCANCPARLQHSSWTKATKDVVFFVGLLSAIAALAIQVMNMRK